MPSRRWEPNIFFVIHITSSSGIQLRLPMHNCMNSIYIFHYRTFWSNRIYDYQTVSSGNNFLNITKISQSGTCYQNGLNIDTSNAISISSNLRSPVRLMRTIAANWVECAYENYYDRKKSSIINTTQKLSIYSTQKYINRFDSLKMHSWSTCLEKADAHKYQRIRT